MRNAVSVVSIHISSSTEEISGVGIVIKRKPLSILAPSHLVTPIELGKVKSITINGIPAALPRILNPSGFSSDGVTLLEFKAIPKDLLVKPIRIPKNRPELLAHDKVSILSSLSTPSTIDNVEIISSYNKEGEPVIIIDTETKPGMSGSAVTYKGRLCAVCQGMTAQHRMIAIPLSNESLRTLNAITSRRKLFLASGLFMFFVFLSTLFPFTINKLLGQPRISEVKIDNKRTVVIYTEHNLLSSTPRRRSYLSPITSMCVAKDRTGKSYVVIGTDYSSGNNGEVSLLDSRGVELWHYKISPRDCVYNITDFIFSDFKVIKMMAYDLNNDKQDEIIVAMQGHHWYPSSLIILDLNGNVISQYWHPGFILNFVAGRVGNAEAPLVVATAINNDLYAMHCKAIFAFAGENIAGQGPPYLGKGQHGTELWYKVIPPISPKSGVTITDLDILDEGDTRKNEIVIETRDGRFYYLDRLGNVTHIAQADWFKSSSFPDLISIVP